MKLPRPPLGSIWLYEYKSALANMSGSRQGQPAKKVTVVAVNYTQSVSGNYTVLFDDGWELNLSEFNRYTKQEWLKPAGQLTAKMLKLLYGS